MSLDNATVQKIARLARLEVADERVAKLAAELNNILGWVEQLNQVPTEGVEPMTSVVAMKLAWRADEVADGGQPAAVIANAPDPEDGFFAVPKVIE